MPGDNSHLGLAPPTVDLSDDALALPEEWGAPLPEPVDLSQFPATDDFVAGLEGGPWAAAEARKAEFERQAAEMQMPAEEEELPLPPMESVPGFDPVDAPGMAPRQGFDAPEALTQPGFGDAGQLQAPSYFETMTPDPEEHGDPLQILEPAALADDPDPAALAAEYASMSPDALVSRFAREDGIREKDQAQREGDELAEDRRIAEENESRRAKAMATADQESKRLRDDIQRLSERRIDEDDWRDSRSGGQSIAMYLGAMIGGFLSPHTGGRNPAMEAIDRAISRNIDAQKANIANERQSLGMRQSLLGELRQSTNNDFEAAEAMRLVRLKQTQAMLANEAQKFDPAGTTARNIFGAQQELAARLQAGEQAQAEGIRKRYREDAEFEIKRAKYEADIRKTRAETAKLLRRGTGGQKKLSLRDAEFADSNGMVRGPDGNWHRRSGYAQGQDVKGQADTVKAQAEAEKAKREIQSDPMAVRSIATGEHLAQPDGTPWRTDKAEDIGVKMAQTQIARRVVDKIKILRKQHNGSSKWIESDEFQEVQALVKKLDMDNAVALGLGAISKDDLVQLMGFRGGVDPTSYWLDASKGLETMAENMEESTRTYMRQKGWKGEPWSPARMTKAKAYERTPEQLIEHISTPFRPHHTDADREQALADANANLDVLLARDDVTREHISDVARRLSVGIGESFDRETAESIIQRAAGKYDELKAKEGRKRRDIPSDSEQLEYFDDAERGLQLEDPAHTFRRIVGGE